MSTEELRAALIGVMHGQRRHLEDCAARHELSAQLGIALLQLRQAWPPGPVAGGAPGRSSPQCDAAGMPMRELAGRISCDPSQVTGIADRLESMALVERQPSPQDRRVKLLVLTEAGDALAARLADDVNRDAPGFAELSDDDRSTLLALLRRLLPEA